MKETVEAALPRARGGFGRLTPSQALKGPVLFNEGKKRDYAIATQNLPRNRRTVSSKRIRYYIALGADESFVTYVNLRYRGARLAEQAKRTAACQEKNAFVLPQLR